MSKKCKCFCAPQYHRDDCPEYDVNGKLKMPMIKIVCSGSSSSLNEMQSKSRLNRKPQEKSFYIIDYHQKLGNHPLDENQIKDLAKLQKKLKDLIEELDIKISI